MLNSEHISLTDSLYLEIFGLNQEISDLSIEHNTEIDSLNFLHDLDLVLLNESHTAEIDSLNEFKVYYSLL